MSKISSVISTHTYRAVRWQTGKKKKKKTRSFASLFPIFQILKMSGRLLTLMAEISKHKFRLNSLTGPVYFQVLNYAGYREIFIQICGVYSLDNLSNVRITLLPIKTMKLHFVYFVDLYSILYRQDLLNSFYRNSL